PPTPLFSASDPIEITLTGPIAEIARKAATSTEAKPASLGFAGETQAIELSARGNARRRPETCKFPPLRVKFASAPAGGSLFAGQKTLKLVTHCRSAESFQQHTLLEYAAYRVYNQLTEASFRVRLAKVRYVEGATGKLVAERVGFFIEDIDDLADRVGLDDVKAAGLKLAQHDPEAAARAVLFFHMIANHDWSMLAGPEGECCHNGKLLGPDKAATSGLTYVPYDFDYSGLVDTPYAVPPEDFGIKSVRTRYYRGACAQNADIPRVAAHFRERRAAVLDAVNATPGMQPKTATRAIKYLDDFYAEIADDAAVKKLLKRCR
ncbi:MAG: hypothetical protein ABL957_14520, partial [Parvularculaceae bacterium]